MNRPEPPRLATWLLERCEGSEHLAGDLVERYAGGKRAGWYWRQVLMAVLAGAGRDIRAHKLLAVRGVIAGFVLVSLFGRYVVPYPLAHFDSWLFVRGLGDIREWWPSHQFLMAVLPGAGGICVGWIVARWHRMSIVLLFVAALMLRNALWICLLVALHVNVLGVVLLWNFPAQALSVLAIMFAEVPISILLGGLWGAPASKQPHRLEKEIMPV